MRSRNGSVGGIGFLALLLGLIIFGIHFLACSLPYQQNVEGYLKQAADANSISTAEQRLEKVTKYLSENNMTNGYTSLVYRTPDEDVGFWYNNLVSAQEQLRLVANNPNASALETTNVLMKLRETITDQGSKGNTEITQPQGISRYPHNVAWALILTLATILSVVGGLMVFFSLNVNSSSRF